MLFESYQMHQNKLWVNSLSKTAQPVSQFTIFLKINHYESLEKRTEGRWQPAYILPFNLNRINYTEKKAKMPGVPDENHWTWNRTLKLQPGQNWSNSVPGILFWNMWKNGSGIHWGHSRTA